jgi:hypothetical protein
MDMFSNLKEYELLQLQEDFQTILRSRIMKIHVI